MACGIIALRPRIEPCTPAVEALESWTLDHQGGPGRNFQTALSSLPKICLTDWYGLSVLNILRCSAFWQALLEQRRKHCTVHNILPFAHELCRDLRLPLLRWENVMLPDLHSNVCAPIWMEKQVPPGGKNVNKFTDFFLHYYLLPPSPQLAPLPISLFPLLLYWKLSIRGSL